MDSTEQPTSEDNKPREDWQARAKRERAEIADVLAWCGLSLRADFVPWSQSRNRNEKQEGYTVLEGSKRVPAPRYSLNWRVSILHNGRAVHLTDYGQGVAHAPVYKEIERRKLNQHQSEQYKAIKAQCEHGQVMRYTFGGWHKVDKWIEQPDAVDFFACTVSDAMSVLNDPNFSSWARDFGYDDDSMKAKAAFDACVETALKLRACVGDDGLEILQTAYQDF